MNLKYIWLLVLFLMLAACSEDNETTPQQEPIPALDVKGLDFSNYVAIGGSFTAGYTDGALFKNAQDNSFPNSLSKLFKNANGGEFKQPLMNDNTGVLVLPTPPNTDYRFVFNGEKPQRLNEFIESKGGQVPVPTTLASVNLKSAFNNMGVPGAKSFHFVFEGYGALNPYFGRMASSPSASVLKDAIAQKPTFFTLSEVGGNDVLGYALAGGDGVDQTGNTDVKTYGLNDITDPGKFTQVFGSMVTALTANNAKGIVTNVPYITSLPHFTTVPYNPIPMDTATASQVNAAYKEYNNALLQLEANTIISKKEREQRTITFKEGNNPVVILDEYLTNLTSYNPKLISMRQATAEDLLVLSSSAIIGKPAIPNNPKTINGVAVPLADKWVLTPQEQLAIKTATDAYNVGIANVIAKNDAIALVDLNTILQQAATTGIVFDNYTLTADFVTGGVFGLDGVHPTARGYALMANKFLEAIDAKFGSNFIASKTTAAAANYPITYPVNLQ